MSHDHDSAVCRFQANLHFWWLWWQQVAEWFACAGCWSFGGSGVGMRTKVLENIRVIWGLKVSIQCMASQQKCCERGEMQAEVCKWRKKRWSIYCRFLFTIRPGGVTGPRAPQSGFAFYIMRYFCLVLGTASSSCIFFEGALSFISFLN